MGKVARQRRMRVRRFSEYNGEKPYDACKFRTLIRRLRRHLPHLGEGFKMRRLSIDLLSFVTQINLSTKDKKAAVPCITTATHKTATVSPPETRAA